MGCIISGCTSFTESPEVEDDETTEEESVTPPSARPNIVVILTDDQNKDTVGCYDGTVSTPNIDRLAANGIKFNNANVVTTVSSPSRYSLLTGRYYNSNYSDEFLADYPEGVTTCTGNDCYLEDDKQNLAGILQSNGYTTGFVGKFHNTQHDAMTPSNWATYGLTSFDSTSDPLTNEATNEAMKFNHDWWCDQIRPFGFDYVNGVYAANLKEIYCDAANIHNVEWTMDSAVKFLEQQEGSSDPFMLWVATTYTHGPAPENLSGGLFIRSIDSEPRITGEGVREDLDGSFPSPTRAEIREMYDRGEVTQDGAPALWWDASVGAILDQLDEMGVTDNTIIVYLSDHGYMYTSEGVNYHGKSSLYEDGVTIPMIMQWKNGMAQGAVYDNLFGSIDLTPTLLDAAGVDISGLNIDGISMTSMFFDMSAEPRDKILLEMGYARAVKTTEYCYIAVRYPDSPETKLHNDEAGKYYYFTSSDLSGLAADSYPNYFDADQMYDYHNDRFAKDNLFRQDPKRDAEYQEMLSEELKKYSNRPYGEFN